MARIQLRSRIKTESNAAARETQLGSSRFWVSAHKCLIKQMALSKVYRKRASDGGFVFPRGESCPLDMRAPLSLWVS